MRWGVSGSSSRRKMAGCAVGRAPGPFHYTVLGMLLTGVSGFFCPPGAMPAASQRANAADSRAGATGVIEQQAVKGEETRISPNDLLFIQVFDVDQMTREYRVSDSGTVDFPLLAAPVRVAGLTPQQAAEALAQKCKEAGVLSRPQISVTVRESRLHAVAVLGSVKNPQVYPVFGHIPLLDVLTLAGGASDDAGSVVTITRGEVSRALAAQAGGGGQAGKSPPPPSTVSINLQRLLEGSDPNLNVNVYPGDRVTVQRAGIVYVMGAVNKAGGYLLSDARQNMTVLKAIALAGYFGPFAKGKKALLLRPNPSAPNGREEIPVNLHAMLRGNVPDQPLFDNDILFVPDSTALKALHRSADIAATTASYAALYRVGP